MAQTNSFSEVIKQIDGAIADFNSSMPAVQNDVLTEVLNQLKRLDLNGDTIKTTVANLKIIGSIKQKLQGIILSDDYLDKVNDFVSTFTSIATLQNVYFKEIESTFKPFTLLDEIKVQAIDDTVASLTEQGIGANIINEVAGILNDNITVGGTYKQLEQQLRQSLTDTKSGDGLITKYTKQITTDAVNQYSAQYTQAVAQGYDFEWYAYQGSDIMTTRPFCFAVTDFRYFHVSQVPGLLQAKYLNGPLLYKTFKDPEYRAVPIYDKTQLPGGMIEGTNPSNFFIRRGGYNCGHQCRPVTEAQVPQDILDKVKATSAYKAMHPNSKKS